MRTELFTELFRSASLSGAEKALTTNGLLAEQLSPAAAYRLYGRSDVGRWLQEGLIRFQPAKGRSSKRLLDRRQLEKIAAASNRPTYLPVAER